ncbi:DUF3093 domain-containing protein [Microbacterium sp.]|uniref:DUF3093 domain-containing protein n=1 Tax=Microbacterium sp. TaxID=51671 RepID=UPI003A8AAF0F
MHTHPTDAPRPVRYRERLAPSLWALASAAVCAPMVALVFTPVDATLALVVGAGAGILLIAILVLASSVVEIDDRELRVGRAHISLGDLGRAEALTGDAARTARGHGLRRDWWHLIRGGIDGLVLVEVTDPDDPHTAWVFSSRTPERIVAILDRAQSPR